MYQANRTYWTIERVRRQTRHSVVDIVRTFSGCSRWACALPSFAPRGSRSLFVIKSLGVEDGILSFIGAVFARPLGTGS